MVKKIAPITPLSREYPILEVRHSTGDPLFAASFHPTASLFVTGTASGQVKLFKYDADKLEDAVIRTGSKKDLVAEDLPACTSIEVYGKEVDLDDVENEAVIVGWKTKRHKGSCRDIKFDCEGRYIYSAGRDGVIKKADVETGKVVGKVKRDSTEEGAITRILTVPNKPFLIVGDENGDVKCYDTKEMKPIYELKKAHKDTVNDISYCVPKSDYRFVSVGSMTLANWDIRKEKILHRSENQEDEILTCSWVDQDTQKTLLCGMAGGIVTVWKPEYNEFEDQISRIRMDKEESVESIISSLEDDDCSYVGLSNGIVTKINSGNGRKIEMRHHSEDGDDNAGILDMDYEYRLVSCGVEKLKIWSRHEEGEAVEEDEGEGDEEDEGGEDSDSSLPIDQKPGPEPKFKKQKIDTETNGIGKFEGL
ncbi:DEKNAAC103084 [Brettanomyces naardenensis]|uniref:WD repeat-containing protein JIP5 n=1 Tax=Brettanomyces naardenensis TaxID=13370 RepID=A0A448YMD9_BRENA|nr:DEKNAAC103084 [Brettanomyces naardenensis]